MPAHHKLEVFLDEYLKAASIGENGRSPLFRAAAGRTRRPGPQGDEPGGRLSHGAAPGARCGSAGLDRLPYLPGQLYDRTGDEITLEEVERIRI
jgi:hypothetical protein